MCKQQKNQQWQHRTLESVSCVKLVQDNVALCTGNVTANVFNEAQHRLCVAALNGVEFLGHVQSRCLITGAWVMSGSDGACWGLAG
jgi:hypothetical protein